MPSKFAPLFKRGWPCLPLSADGKTPLVSGYHGKYRKRPDRDTVIGWSRSFPECNPGIVMPDNVIGLDVDGPSHGVDGLAALEEFESLFGPLPESGWIYHGLGTDGEPSPYGTRLYRIPDDMLDVYTPGRIVGNLDKVTGKPGVDIIAPWIRYNLAPGAVHAKTGETYEFFPSPMPGIPWLPKPSDLPALTREQVKGLLKKKREPKETPSHGVKPLVSVPSAPTTAKERASVLLDQTRALAALDEGQTLLIEGAERGWQKNDGFYVLACALARIAKNREKAGRLFVAAAAPYDDAERQWENAVASVEEEEEEMGLGETEPYRVCAIQQPDTFTGEYLERNYLDDDGNLTLRFADLRYWLWCGTHYRPLLPEEVRARLSNDLRGCLETAADGPRPITLNNRLKSEVLGALQDRTLVSEHGAGTLLPVVGGVPFRNGWLNVETGQLEPLSPARDIRWIVPDDYDPDAPEPHEWLRFLKSIGWGPGTPEYRLLRQWMGYLLSGRTDQQKAMMFVGPPRAGKGTILKVCEAMLGEGSVGIDLSAFSTNFGLSPTIGKSLAFVDDARFEIKTDKALVRRVLSMVAEGTMTIDRKHKDPVSIRSTARLMLATNEVPAMIEASMALASRFLFLKFTESYLDKEDLGLMKRVLSDLPGIVRWALDGLADLQSEGRFSETSSGNDLKREMTEIANPIRIWVDEQCALVAETFTTTDELHSEYAVWAEQRRYYVPTPAVFARDLNAAYPDSVIRRGQRRRGDRMVRGFIGLKMGRA